MVSSTAKPALEHGDFVVKVDDKVCVRVTLKATFTVKYASLRSGKVGAFYYKKAIQIHTFVVAPTVFRVSLNLRVLVQTSSG